MKTQLSKASDRLAKYSAEYRQQALEHWRLSGRSAAKVAAELGIRPPLLCRWARQERAARAHRGDASRDRAAEAGEREAAGAA